LSFQALQALRPAEQLLRAAAGAAGACCRRCGGLTAAGTAACCVCLPLLLLLLLLLPLLVTLLQLLLNFSGSLCSTACGGPRGGAARCAQHLRRGRDHWRHSARCTPAAAAALAVQAVCPAAGRRLLLRCRLRAAVHSGGRGGLCGLCCRTC
jgi:hypothetical protein